MALCLCGGKDVGFQGPACPSNPTSQLLHFRENSINLFHVRPAPGPGLLRAEGMGEVLPGRCQRGWGRGGD